MKIITYSAPAVIPKRNDFSVRVRVPGGKWEPLEVYEVKVDMHQVREASMAYFDMEGAVETEITYHAGTVESAVIRPLSFNIPFE
ncbi:hypothetical protein [Paenibacillus alkalitolerans]|uniref:hypothetical protein n=1 Tax=Paenibacillus alkalitolerans TaxID=2799335 RepID=UPI001F32D635|nr:hypothetical protein [Paenibacillus alkalitolerans]